MLCGSLSRVFSVSTKTAVGGIFPDFLQFSHYFLFYAKGSVSSLIVLWDSLLGRVYAQPCLSRASTPMSGVPVLIGVRSRLYV